MAAQTIYEKWDILAARASRLFRLANDERASPAVREKAGRIWVGYFQKVALPLAMEIVKDRERRGGYVDIPPNLKSKASPLITKPEYIIPPSLRK